jgi:hypothetical protein
MDEEMRDEEMRRCGDEDRRLSSQANVASAIVIPSERSESRDLHLGARECEVALLRAY